MYGSRVCKIVETGKNYTVSRVYCQKLHCEMNWHVFCGNELWNVTPSELKVPRDGCWFSNVVTVLWVVAGTEGGTNFEISNVNLNKIRLLSQLLMTLSPLLLPAPTKSQFSYCNGVNMPWLSQ